MSNKQAFLQYRGAASLSLRASITKPHDLGWSQIDWRPDNDFGPESLFARGPQFILYSDDLERSRSDLLRTDANAVSDIFPCPVGRGFYGYDGAGTEFTVWSDR